MQTLQSKLLNFKSWFNILKTDYSNIEWLCPEWIAIIFSLKSTMYYDNVRWFVFDQTVYNVFPLIGRRAQRNPITFRSCDHKNYNHNRLHCPGKQWITGHTAANLILCYSCFRLRERPSPSISRENERVACTWFRFILRAIKSGLCKIATAFLFEFVIVYTIYNVAFLCWSLNRWQQN